MSKRVAALRLALFGIASCTANPVLKEIPSPAETGSTLYVLEVYNDFLDDGGKLYDPREGSPKLFGEQATEIILRAARRLESVRLVGFVHQVLKANDLNILVVEEPLHYFQPRGGGTFVLADSPLRGFFKLAINPVLSSDGAQATLTYALLRGVPNRRPVDGTELQGGEPTFIAETTLEDGIRTIPLKGTAFWSVRRGDGRMYFLLLHMATVAAPVPTKVLPPRQEWVEIGWCPARDFRNRIRPHLQERGIPAVIPEDAPNLGEDPLFSYGAFYCPREMALEARRIGTEVMKTTEWGFKPGTFLPLGSAWIYIGAAPSDEVDRIILPLLKSKAFEPKGGHPYSGRTGVYVQASRSRQAQELVTQEMKSRGRPFEPASE